MSGLVSQDRPIVEKPLGPGGRPRKIPRQLQGPPGEEPWRLALERQRRKVLTNTEWDCGECGLESLTRPECSQCGGALVGAGFVGGPDR